MRGAITVADLVEQLGRYPSDAYVILEDDDGYFDPCSGSLYPVAHTQTAIHGPSSFLPNNGVETYQCVALVKCRNEG